MEEEFNIIPTAITFTINDNSVVEDLININGRKYTRNCKFLDYF